MIGLLPHPYVPHPLDRVPSDQPEHSSGRLSHAEGWFAIVSAGRVVHHYARRDLATMDSSDHRSRPGDVLAYENSGRRAFIRGHSVSIRTVRAIFQRGALPFVRCAFGRVTHGRRVLLCADPGTVLLAGAAPAGCVGGGGDRRACPGGVRAPGSWQLSLALQLCGALRPILRAGEPG